MSDTIKLRNFYRISGYFARFAKEKTRFQSDDFLAYAKEHGCNMRYVRKYISGMVRGFARSGYIVKSGQYELNKLGVPRIVWTTSANTVTPPNQ